MRRFEAAKTLGVLQRLRLALAAAQPSGSVKASRIYQGVGGVVADEALIEPSRHSTPIAGSR